MSMSRGSHPSILRRPGSGRIGLGVLTVAGGLVISCGLQVERTSAPQLDCTSDGCVCIGSFKNCDGDLSNGCEADVQSHPLHCGECNAPCGEGACVAGHCDCHPGWMDCDGDRATGCEAELEISPTDCGVCDHDCHGGSCRKGVCQPEVLVSCGWPPLNLVRTDSYLFWQQWEYFDSPVDLFAMPVDASSDPVLLDRSSADCGTSLAADGSAVFWGCGDGIRTMAVGDGAPSLLVPGAIVSRGDAGGQQAIVGGSTMLLWREPNPENTANGPLWQWGAGVAGDAPLLVHEAIEAGPVLSADYVYFETLHVNAVWRAAHHTAPVEPELVYPASVAELEGVFGGFLYFWANDGDLLRKPELGGEEELLLEREAFEHGAVVADASGVYVLSVYDGEVAHLDPATKVWTVIAEGQLWPSSPQVDDRFVYWLTYSGVMRLVKRPEWQLADPEP